MMVVVVEVEVVVEVAAAVAAGAVASRWDVVHTATLSTDCILRFNLVDFLVFVPATGQV
jgi:hypothetical protein